MSEIITTYRHLLSFSTYCGPNRRPMAQITLADHYGGVPADELDRMCIEWCTARRIVVALGDDK
jgi:hypothetical protein